MPKKEKPMRRASKPLPESATYTTAELCARYHCSRRTLRRMTASLGYPEGIKRGKTVIYAKVAVHDWELKNNMGSLHVEPEKTEEDKHWDRLRRRYLLEKEEQEAEPPPIPKPKRATRASI